MNNPENNTWLDKELSKIIGSEKKLPDFELWKKEHARAVKTLTSKANDTSVSKGPLSIRNIIMKSQIKKIAIAAVIIIIVTLVLHNSSVNISTPAFAFEDVYNAIDKVQWIHCTMTLVEMSGDTETEEKQFGYGWESWGRENPYISAEKHTDGFIAFNEETDKGIKKSIYIPRTNSITINYESADSPEFNGSYKDAFKAQMRKYEDDGSKVEYKESFLEGRAVTTIILDYTPKDGDGYNSIISIIVDSDTYLPIKMEWQQIALKKNLTGKMIGIYDYPETGPTDIYELGVPIDTKIIYDDQEAN